MDTFGTMILRALAAMPSLTRFTRKILPHPFDYVVGKPLERWYLIYDLGRRRLALGNDPGIVENVMQDRAGNFPKSAIMEPLLEPLIGCGVFGQPGGRPVKEARRLFIQALARLSDEDIAEVARNLANEYVDRWLVQYSKRPVPICTELARLTVDIVSRCTLNGLFDDSESARFAELFFIFHQRCNPLPILVSDFRPETVERLVQAMGIRPIGAEMRRLIYERFVLPMMEQDAAALSAPFAQSLREAGLLAAASSHAGRGEATNPKVLDEVAVMLLAGHETTASALSWLFWELARRPEEQRAASSALTSAADGSDRAPVERAGTGSRGGAAVPARIRALIREVLRLYPPIAFYLRDTLEETAFRDKPLARGSLFVISPWTLQRHRKKWAQPDEFLPERWLAPDPEPARTSFMPFGMGPRACPGARFADVEMREIVGVIVSRCRLALSSNEQPKPLGSLTSRPDREIYLKLEPIRASKAA